MTNLKFDYGKLNEILYDNNNILSNLNNHSYSIYDDEDASIYFLYGLMDENDEYSKANICRDIYNTLYFMNKGHDFDVIFSKYSPSSNLNKSDLNKLLIEKQFFEYDSSKNIDVSKELSNLNTSQLRNLLKKYNISTFGKRKKLIKIAEENIPEYEFISSEFKISPKGEKFLNDYEWINIYEGALYKFDFTDYYKFINQNKGKSALDFIDLHIKNANNSHDLIYLDYCFIAKGLFYLINHDFENALIWELKRFILRINPPYSHFGYYSEFLIFNPDNIYRINICMDKMGIDDVGEFFNKAWDSLQLRKKYVSRDTAYSFFKRALNEDYDDLSNEFMDKYLESTEEYAYLANEFYKLHDYILSRDISEIALESDSSLEEVLFYESLSLIHLKDFDWALDIIDEVLELNSDDGRYWASKAIVDFEIHNLDSAIENFKKALSLNPQDSFILNSIGVCYARNNKTDDAIKYFEKAIQYSQDIYPKLNLAKIHIKLKDWDGVEKYFADIEKTTGQSLDYLMEKGCYYLIRNDYENALECFNNCIDNHYCGIVSLTLKYLTLYELGHGNLYNQFKNKIQKLDLNFVKSLEKYLQN